jgi:hypothetical protein
MIFFNHPIGIVALSINAGRRGMTQLRDIEQTGVVVIANSKETKQSSAVIPG